MGNTGNVHFAVTTKDAKAQEFITQGIGLLHGFWYFEAERSFRQAASLDPECGMAYWGMAMANFNNEKRAKPFLAEAQKRKAALSAREKLYVDALAQYFDDSKRDNAARRRDLTHQYENIIFRHPDDLEAKAFLLWQLWDNSQHGVPIESKVAMNALIGEVLAKEPMHPVHHYRIHITPPAEDKTKALASAALCGQSASAIPHMWHMPGHTYSDAQRYADAVYQQEAALRVENANMMRMHMLSDETYLFVHNRNWLLDNLSFTGRTQEAMDLCENMVDLPRHPKFGRATANDGRRKLVEILHRHERWDDLLDRENSPYLSADDDPAFEARRLVALGHAHVAKKHADSAGQCLLKLQEHLTKIKAEQKKAGEDAEAAARKEKKPDAEIGQARKNAENGKNDLKAKFEEAMAELEGHQKMALGQGSQAVALLEKGHASPEELSRAYLAANNPAKAEELTRDVAGRAYRLANRVFILQQTGKKEEAVKAFETLRSLAGSADLAEPVYARIKPLAEELKMPADWRTPVAAADVGFRPPPASLGPLHWHPWKAAGWSLPDLEDRTVSLSDFRGKPVIVILYLGLGCVHCVEQLEAFGPFKEKFDQAGIALVAISTDTLDSMKASLKTAQTSLKPAFPILADPSLAVFKTYKSYDDFERKPLHGTFLIDGEGRLRWQDIGYEPFKNAEFLLAEAQRILKQTKNRPE